MSEYQLMQQNDTDDNDGYSIIGGTTYSSESAAVNSVKTIDNDAETEPDQTYIAISKTLKVVRYILLAIIVFTVLLSVTALSSIVNVANIKEFIHSFSDTKIEYNREAYASISGDDLLDIDVYKDYISVLRSDRIEIYRRDGSKVITKRITMSEPSMAISEKYILLYDFCGNTVQLYNTYDIVCERKMPNSIYIADVSKNGSVAVLTHEVANSSVLIAYDSELNEKFRWNSSDKYTFAVKMLDNNYLAAASVNSTNGDSSVYFNLFNIKNGTCVNHTYTGTIPIKIGKTSIGNYLLCNDRILFYDKNGDEIKSVNLTEYGNNISDAYDNGSCVVVALSETEDSDNSVVILFNSHGDIVLKKSEDFDITSIACTEENIYYILQDSLVTYDLKSEEISSELLNDNYYDIKTYKNSGIILTSDAEAVLYM